MCEGESKNNGGKRRGNLVFVGLVGDGDAHDFLVFPEYGCLNLGVWGNFHLGPILSIGDHKATRKKRKTKAGKGWSTST